MGEVRKRGVSATEAGSRLLEEARVSQRNEKGKPWTKANVAAEAGLDERTIRRFFKRECVDEASARSICDALKISFSDVVTNDSAAEPGICMGEATPDRKGQLADNQGNLTDDDLPTLPSAKPSPIPENISRYRSGISEEDFVGREADIDRLHAELQRSSTVSITAALSGMGGVGKTEMVLQYARRQYQAETYPGGVCFFDATRNVGADIASFANNWFNLNQPETVELSEWVQNCWRQWREGNVLVIFDGLNNDKDYERIKPYLPPNLPRFKVLLTTRERIPEPIARIDLDVLKPRAALKLLASFIDDARLRKEPWFARKLCRWLGYLPLGLELVGRYLAQDEDLSLSKMWELLQERALECAAVYETDPRMTAKLGVAAAFELSWICLSPSTRMWGCILGLFASAPISWSWLGQSMKALVDKRILTHNFEHNLDGAFKGFFTVLDEKWQKLAYSLLPARIELVQFNLLRRVSPEVYQLHSLLKEFFAIKCEQSASADLLKRMVATILAEVAETIPQVVTLAEQERVQDFIPHLEIAIAELMLWLTDEGRMVCGNGLARFYRAQGLITKAEQCLLQTLAACEQLNRDNVSTAKAINNLAGLYKWKGQNAQAEDLYKRSLGIYQRHLGTRHYHTSTALNNLGALYLQMNRYEEAEPLLLEALSIREEKCGSDHHDTAQSLTNLALCYFHTKRYDQAEVLFRRSILIIEQNLGSNNVQLVMSLNGLADLYQRTKRETIALNLYRQSLRICREHLSLDHAYTTIAINNLSQFAFHCFQRGNLHIAKVGYLDLIPILEQRQGNQHFITANIYGMLGGVYRLMKQYDDAEVYLKKALKIHEEQCGQEALNTASSLHNLALLYDAMQDYIQAESYYVKSISICMKYSKDKHPIVQEASISFRAFLEDMLRNGYVSSLSNHPVTQLFLLRLWQP